MKMKSLKIFDKMVMALLGLFPFFSGCDEPRELYGTPTATYQLKETASDSLPVDQIGQTAKVSTLKDFKLTKE